MKDYNFQQGRHLTFTLEQGFALVSKGFMGPLSKKIKLCPTFAATGRIF